MNAALFVVDLFVRWPDMAMFSCNRGSWPAVVLAVVSVIALWACKQPPAGRPDPASTSYVGRAVCAGCHARQDSLWQGSDHDLAMQPAADQTVLGDFDDATFSHSGVTTRFFRDGDRFMVRTEGPTGQMETFEVSYTLGFDPLQQYLVKFPDGRVQCLTVAWDTKRKAWFSLHPDERIAPDDWLHWTKGGMNWNYMCASCHSTHLQRNYDLATDTYATTWSEIDVSCEACHGPGEAHAAWARRYVADPRSVPLDDRWLGLTVRMKDREHARWQIETCAPCHSRRRVLTDDFAPGDDFLDHYEPALLDDGLYFADGQIEDEVYVYGSFLQSKMYHNGVRCSDCHDPHSTKLKKSLDDNALCLQCHQVDVYDGEQHHFHTADQSPAATQCVSCHMPVRTYMVVDPRRDHSFRIPRPDLTVDLGVPNACNAAGCHADRSAAWAAGWVERWYGPERPNEPHFARAFAAGRAEDPHAIPALAHLAGDTLRPAIVRATALSLLRRFDTAASSTAAESVLDDAEPLVRTEAVRSIEHLPPEDVDRLVAHLVADTVRLVRTEAARVLAQTDRYALDDTASTVADTVFRKALAEYRHSQEVVADQAPAHFNLAVLYEQEKAWRDAEREYRTALRLDSTFVPAHLNLAMLYDRMRLDAQQQRQDGRARQLRQAVERQLRTAVAIAPATAEAHYSLGLLLAEEPNHLADATRHLATAARLSPDDARIQYNTGLSYQHQGAADSAEVYLVAAYHIEPETLDYVNALSILYIQQERWQQALRYTADLAKRYPQSTAAQERLRYLRTHMK